MNGFSGEFDLIPAGWSGGFRGKQLYDFCNDERDPLTWSDGNGIMIRPDRHFVTDMGSVPLTLQFIAPGYFAKDRWIRSFILHDSAFLHGGHWFAVKGGWEFRELTMKQANKYLQQMVISEGGSKVTAWLIYAGVQIGGRASWKRKVPPSDTMPLTPAVA